MSTIVEKIAQIEAEVSFDLVLVKKCEVRTDFVVVFGRWPVLSGTRPRLDIWVC